MNRILLSAISALLMLGSCASRAGVHHSTIYDDLPAIDISRPFVITDFMHKAEEHPMPAWVEYWLEGGVSAIEASGLYGNRHAFVSRNEGTSFNALNQWVQWFSPNLDFPRLAAARIEARFLHGVTRPDSVYGDFFVALIRAASDAPWAGAVKEEYFWIRRQFVPPDDEFWEASAAASFVEEDWEFLILVTIDEGLFASQLDEVFRSVRPRTQPNRQQIAAANSVVERFFEGF